MATDRQDRPDVLERRARVDILALSGTRDFPDYQEFPLCSTEQKAVAPKASEAFLGPPDTPGPRACPAYPEAKDPLVTLAPVLFVLCHFQAAKVTLEVLDIAGGRGHPGQQAKEAKPASRGRLAWPVQKEQRALPVTMAGRE